jgi:hypothetical protein
MLLRLEEARSIALSRDPRSAESGAHVGVSMLFVKVSFVAETPGDVDWNRKEAPFCSA